MCERGPLKPWSSYHGWGIEKERDISFRRYVRGEGEVDRPGINRLSMREGIEVGEKKGAGGFPLGGEGNDIWHL